MKSDFFSYCLYILRRHDYIHIMRILELFCGTKSVSKVAVRCGYDEVVSVDANPKCSPTICVSILDFKYKMYPVGYFRFVWASPPCTEFSIAKTVGVRKIAEATLVVQRTLEIINYFQPSYFCIENPVGLLRWQPCMEAYQKFRKTVSYCRYGYEYRKNTDLWTNVVFDAKRCVKGFYCKQKEEKGCHMVICQKGQSSLGTHVKKELVLSLNDRYRVPPQLLTDILENSIEKRKTDGEILEQIFIDNLRRGAKRKMLTFSNAYDGLLERTETVPQNKRVKLVKRAIGAQLRDRSEEPSTIQIMESFRIFNSILAPRKKIPLSDDVVIV